MKLFLSLAAIGLLIAGCQSPTGRSKIVDSSATADSLAVDTSTFKNNDSASNIADSEISALKDINVDKETFKKLYMNTRKVGDDFSDSKYLFDKTSPQYVNRNGMFCYINDNKTNPVLRFKVQYYSEDWLFIKNMTFNIDGKNYEYTPADFKTDNGDGMIWEWSDEPVGETDLPLLIALANAQKAKVKYYGSQYFDVKTISDIQIAGIKKILQIYKGIKLGYKN